MKQDAIQFCYPSSVGGKELVPCYERITEGGLLPPDLLEEMRKKILQNELRERRANKKTNKVEHYTNYPRDASWLSN